MGILVNEWMKEAKRSSSAHNLKGDGKEEIVEDVGESLDFGIYGPKMDEGDGGLGMVDLRI